MPWYDNVKVLGLWANYQSRNAWVYLSGGGIRDGFYKIRDSNFDAVINTFAALAAARIANGVVSVNLDGADKIIEVYMW